MRKILLGTTAVVGLALVAQAANAQQARPAARPAPVAAPAAPPPLPATSVAPTGTAAAIFQTPVGVTGAGPHGNDGVPNVPETPTTSGLVVRLGGYFEFTYGNVQDDADKAFFRNNAGTTAAGKATTTNVIDPGGAVIGNFTTPGAAAVNLNNARGRQRSDFRNDAEINIYVDGRAANGMRYGAMFEMQMDNMVSTAGDGTGVSFDELYGFVKGGWGEIRFGQEDSAASLLQVRRPATQGLGESGDWDEFLPSSGYVGAGVGDGNDATKITYLSPQMMGFEFGVSYAPNRGEGERADNASSTTAFQRDFTGLTNEISAALRYRGTFGGVGLQGSLVGQFADPAQQSANGAPLASKDQNITTYSAGLLLRAFGFAVGGDYTWGNYRTTPANGSIAQGIDGSTQYAAGITYTIGALTIGGVYSVAEQDNGGTVADRTQTYMGVGAAYVLAPGMTLFGSYNQVKDENIPTAAPTSAGATLAKFGPNDLTRDITVLVAGVRVAF